MRKSIPVISTNFASITPVCCAPASIKCMVKAARMIESPDALLEGAVAVSLHGLEPAECRGVDRTLQTYADTIRKRTHSNQPQAILAHLHEFLFEEQGFNGRTEEYTNPAASFLPCVIEQKFGLPITLSLVYKLVGERLGLRIHGIGLTGHFLAAVETENAGGSKSMMLVDPFGGGRILTADEARMAVEQTFGDGFEWNDEILRPVSNLHWLTRIIQNLLHVFSNAERFEDVAAMLELEMVLWPRQTHLQRDLALVLARAGMSHAASAWLNNYLRINPADPQRGDLQQLLEVLSA